MVLSAPFISSASPQGPAAPLKQAPPAINYRERPQFPFEAQRMKRKPVIDGDIQAGEWDALYTISNAAVNGTVYVNWDDQNLYVAARTEQPAWVVLNIDANSDGWLKGVDNSEIALGFASGTGAPTIITRALDGTGKDTPVWNETMLDSAKIRMFARPSASGHMLEIAIPVGWGRITPKTGSKLGFRADFLPQGPAPTPPPPYEPHLLLDLALVETQVLAVAGVVPTLILDDSRLAPGQELQAKLELRVEGEKERKIKAVSWKGEGAAFDLLRGFREVNLPAVNAQKPLTMKYASVLPDTAPLAAYQLTCTVELEAGGTASATASFTVADPFIVSMPNEPESILSSDLGRVRIPIEIKSALPTYEYANISIDVPAGWSVQGRDSKKFQVTKEDDPFRVLFYVNPPAGVNPGTYRFSATVSFNGKDWHANRILKVVRPGTLPPPNREKKP
jgi:hypothetical protein